MNEPTFNRSSDEIEHLQAEMNELRHRLDEAAVMLQAERRMFQTMTAALADIVFTALPDGSWDFVNARLYEITGLPEGEALGAGWTRALHPDDLGRVMQDMREAVESRTPFESDFRFRIPQGTYRRFVAQAHPLCDDSDRIARWIGTITDVDDLLTAEETLDQTRRENQASLAKLAHDLRNAIAPIANSAAILRNPNADAAQRQWAVEIIDRQVRDLRAFLDKLEAPATDRQAPPVEAKDPNAARLLKQSTRRILVVASDRDFAEDWSMLLRVAGHDVCAASGIQQAVEVAQEFKPEVLAVNLPLAADVGDEWAQRLRTQPVLATAFIVAIAPDAGALTADCDAVLRKPVKLQEFLQLLAERAVEKVASEPEA